MGIQSRKLLERNLDARTADRATKRQPIVWGLMALGILLTSACSNLGVEPWERGLLAESAMQIEGDSLDSAFDDHIYFSKEASSGGSGFSGGGCGCN